MLKFIKLFSLIALALFAAGCGGNKDIDLGPVTTTDVELANGVKFAAVVNSADAVRIVNTDSVEKSVQAYYTAQGKLWENLDSKDIPMTLAIMKLGGETLPTNGNDARIAEVNADASVKIAKSQANASMVDSVTGGVVKGLLGFKALDVVDNGITAGAAVLQNARPSNNVNVSDNSTFEGAQADSTFDGSTSTTGLQVEPIVVNPITLPESEEDPLLGD